ncbi:MAG TPA: site-2 protease family protein, partial [Candidatus Eisenbacteria bacterium]|nr:site-2 protease family protein [Candidatus Eisenbacteria bacterium]
MTDFITVLFYGALILGVLVLVHELGHFLVAKWLGVRVLQFSIGMGPRVVGFRRGGTDYRISALPLGGYVRMAGDTPEAEERTGAADEFLSKPWWARALITAAG